MDLRDIRYTHRSEYVNRCSFISREITLGDTSGLEAVYRVDEIRKPLRVFNGHAWITVSDTGFTWYQLALRNRRIWLHASFDPTGELVEIYCDVTGGNVFDDPECPCFEDRYLDVVLTPDGELRVLDRDELDEALETGKLTPEQHAQAVADGAALCRDLEANKEAVLEFVRTHRNELAAMLK